MMETLTRNELGSWKNAVTAFLFCALAAIGSPAQTFTPLLDFEYTNGASPESLVRGLDGNFYGVAFDGGRHNEGTAFRITPNGTLTTLYDFCSQSFCTDGYNPQWLIRGSDGNFYGATFQGGDPSCGCGVVFKLTTGGGFSVLYTFPFSSGARPWALIQGIDGNLYGVANSGGANDYGTVFKLTLGGQLTVLYNFCSQSNCADGSFPISLVQSADGTLYGVTEGGGAKGDGTIYKIAPDGIFTILHSFVGSDGNTPLTLIQGADANLYGITSGGGVRKQCPISFDCGTIFRFSRAGHLTTLYSFCSQSGCPDGWEPQTLLQATDGNLYGAAGVGGDPRCGAVFNLGCGTLFQFTLSGTFTTLHTFEMTDGDDPYVLLQDTDGSFYGETLFGGDLTVLSCSGNPGCGTLFNLSTGLGPFVTFTRDFGKVGQAGGILGRGLSGTTGVSLNGTPASFTVVSDTYIQATVPEGGTTGYVTVQTPSGTLTSSRIFRVMH